MAHCTGKIPYWTEKRAAIAIEKAKQREGLDLRYYKCEECKWWHLSSVVRRKERKEVDIEPPFHEEKDY